MSTLTRSRTAQHESGDSGERLFAALLPAQWVLHSYKGTEDYGVDFQVEVFADGNPTGLEFGAQVRTVKAFPRPSTVPSVTVKVSSLVYMASKPYPIMLVVVSRGEKVARYAWLSDLLPPKQLIRQIRSGGDRKGRLRLWLTPSVSLEGASNDIEQHLRERRAAHIAWINDAGHQRQLAGLYLDLHSALDCLIECVALREKSSPPPDEVWHTTTFTLTLVMMAYRTLHRLTSTAPVTTFPPVLTLVGVTKKLRELLVTVHPEQDVANLEMHPDEPHLTPYALEPFQQAVTPLLCLFREVLAALAHFLAPWRNFNIELSGLARSVIEYHGEASHLWARAEPGEHPA